MGKQIYGVNGSVLLPEEAHATGGGCLTKKARAPGLFLLGLETREYYLPRVSRTSIPIRPRMLVEIRINRNIQIGAKIAIYFPLFRELPPRRRNAKKQDAV